jgi:hypothetical protein
VNIPADYTNLSRKERASVRFRYILKQNGLCYYCGESLALPPPKRITDKEIDWTRFPDNFLKHPIHLQHNHKTGMTEGAVHAYCNAVMWQYESK